MHKELAVCKISRNKPKHSFSPASTADMVTDIFNQIISPVLQS